MDGVRGEGTTSTPFSDPIPLARLDPAMAPPRRKKPVRNSAAAAKRPSPTAAAVPFPPAPPSSRLPLTLLEVFAVRSSALSTLQDPAADFIQQASVVRHFQTVLEESSHLAGLLLLPLSPGEDASARAAQCVALGMDNPMALTEAHYLQAFAIHLLSTLLPALQTQAPGAFPSRDPNAPREFLDSALGMYVSARKEREEEEPHLFDAILFTDYLRASCQDGRLNEQQAGMGAVVELIAKLGFEVMLPRAIVGLQTVKEASDKKELPRWGETVGSVRDMLVRALADYARFVKESKKAGTAEVRAGYLRGVAGWMGEMEEETNERRVRASGVAAGKLRMEEEAETVAEDLAKLGILA